MQRQPVSMEKANVFGFRHLSNLTLALLPVEATTSQLGVRTTQPSTPLYNSKGLHWYVTQRISLENTESSHTNGVLDST